VVQFLNAEDSFREENGLGLLGGNSDRKGLEPFSCARNIPEQKVRFWWGISGKEKKPITWLEINGKTTSGKIDWGKERKKTTTAGGNGKISRGPICWKIGVFAFVIYEAVGRGTFHETQ